MYLRNALSVGTVIAAVMSVAPALAATTAIATTPLNVRAGPGPQYQVIGAIADNGQVVVTGCLQGSLWCQVTYNGTQGWAYSQYLAMNRGGQTVVIAEEPAVLPTVTYSGPATAETVGIAAPPIAGTVVETTTAAPIDIAPPPAPVTNYVVANPLDPIYLNGEVVVGASLPETVALTPVPDYDYDYAYVNRVPVLVEPSSRRIVYIYR